MSATQLVDHNRLTPGRLSRLRRACSCIVHSVLLYRALVAGAFVLGALLAMPIVTLVLSWSFFDLSTGAVVVATGVTLASLAVTTSVALYSTRLAGCGSCGRAECTCDAATA